MHIVPPHALRLLLLVALSLPGASLASSSDEARLKRAVTQHQRGRHGDCLRELDKLLVKNLLNRDAALFIEGQCAFYGGRRRRAHRAFTRLAKELPASTLAPLARARAADCLWEQGEKEQAAALYALCEDSRSARLDGAVGLQRRALLAFAAGQTDRGRKLWLALRTEHTNHPLALPAPPGREEPRWDFQQALRLAAALHRARRWPEALALLDSLPDPKAEGLRFRMAHRAAHLLFDTRGSYPLAARMLLGMRAHAPDSRKAEDAWFYGSRALSRSDQDAASIASHLAMAKKHPEGKHRARALFYAGWLEQNRGRRAASIPLFNRVIQEHPKSRWARKARWSKAWSLIRLKRWTQALSALKADRKRPGWRQGGRAMYWSAFCLLAQGKDDAAKTLWLRLLEKHPLSWYSLLARARLGKASPPPPSIADARAAPRPPQDPLLERAGELIRVGLSGLASSFLRQGDRAFRARHPGRPGRLALMSAYREAGDCNKPWRLSVILERSALRSLPDARSRPVWDHAYPRCYRDLIQVEAGKDQSFALLLQSIMRTESGFDPMALSVADARGLLQMIPPTADRVAAAMNLEGFEAQELFEPKVNLATAAWYIGRILKKFKRQWPLVAAAYNGGPPNMMRWCDDEDMKTMELDAFVESIPFTESRKYAKAVTTTMARYAALEGRPLPVLRLKVDRDYLEMEPNF